MSILRTLLVLVLLVAVGFLVMGYLGGLNARDSIVRSEPAVDERQTVERARERAADIGERAAIATEKVEDTLSEATITSKIKAKMALDDSVKALAINVTTHGTTVTLSGTVNSEAERARAIALARETAGVSQVIDDLHRP